MKITRRRLAKELARKIKITITTRRRGSFTAHVPAALMQDGCSAQFLCDSKTQAATWLLVQLRCLPRIEIKITGEKRRHAIII